MQEYAYYHTERVVDPYNPTFWPHNPEIQMDYDPEKEAEKADGPKLEKNQPKFI